MQVSVETHLRPAKGVEFPKGSILDTEELGLSKADLELFLNRGLLKPLALGAPDGAEPATYLEALAAKDETIRQLTARIGVLEQQLAAQVAQPLRETRSAAEVQPGRPWEETGGAAELLEPEDDPEPVLTAEPEPGEIDELPPSLEAVRGTPRARATRRE